MATVATANRSQALASGQRQGTNLISWIPNHELDAHQWAAAGRRIGAVGRCIQWLLGDWIAYGNTKFGERYARASKITGYDAQTLMNMVYVALRFPISRRRESLSWSHHETLAAMDPDEQDHWLTEVSKHRWSVSDLRMMLRAVRKKEGDSEIPGEPSDFSPASGPLPTQAQHKSTYDSSGAGACKASSLRAAVTCPRCGEQVPLAST